MDKDNLEKKKKLMTDLRTDYGREYGHLGIGFKRAVIGYYVLFGLLIAAGGYDMVNVAIAKKAIELMKAEEICSMSQISGLQELQEKTQLQIKETNQLIEWLFADIHGQRLVHALFANLSKEVILEKFSFKRDGKSKNQVTLSINLKGDYRELHSEIETMLSKLEDLGFMLISQNQLPINGGMQLQFVCQMNVLKNNKK